MNKKNRSRVAIGFFQKSKIGFARCLARAKRKINCFLLFLRGLRSSSHWDQFILVLENLKSDLFFGNRLYMMHMTYDAVGMKRPGMY